MLHQGYPRCPKKKVKIFSQSLTFVRQIFLMETLLQFYSVMFYSIPLYSIIFFCLVPSGSPVSVRVEAVSSTQILVSWQVQCSTV